MRWKALAVTAVLAAAIVGSARAATTTTTLVVSGHGWGHGVGMSQWGAYGYALHGWKYGRILTHYYPGTKLSHEGEPRVRVLLADDARTVTVGCATQLTVSNGRRFTGHLAAKTYGISAALDIPVRHRPGKRPFARRFALFSCTRAPLTFDGRPYRGTISLRSNGRMLFVVNGLKLDQYVRGVVPSESPSRWPLAELEAQAVAARSYAVAALNPSAPYDLVPDQRDQVYGGITPQTPRTNRAVQKTRGQILTFDGQVARTYYSSSSGGRTESAQDAWPGSAPIPYLRSVPDPWDTYSPNHDWGPYAYTGDQLGARLGLEGSVESARIVRNASLRAAAVWLHLSSGSEVNLSGPQVASMLGLKSTWFSIGELSVTASTPRVLYGSSVRVVARALETKGAVLQEQRPDGIWRTLQHVHEKSVLTVEPQASTAFRLRIAGVDGGDVEVAVRPRLSVEALGRHLLGGEVLPRAAGPVEVLRRERGVWRVVSRPRIRPSGQFRTRLRLRATVYRVTTVSDAFTPAVRRLVVTRAMLAAMSR